MIHYFTYLQDASTNLKAQIIVFASTKEEANVIAKNMMLTMIQVNANNCVIGN